VAYDTPDEPPPRRGIGTLIARLLLAVLLLFIGGGALWVLNVITTPGPAAPVIPSPPQFQVMPMYVQPDSQAPEGAARVPVAAPQASATPAAPQASASPSPSGQSASAKPTLNSWAQDISSHTDIPVRAMLAYANADLAMRTMAPNCHISWATVASIGRIESKHGRYGGTSLGADGRPLKPIIGPALDGSPGFERIPATDGGALTGDPVWAHAVGPMQFLPSTWAKWGVRASHDGQKPDPQNIDDAALTAARYLCAGGRDLATPQGWWAAVMSYNNSVDYAQQVFAAADAYAKVSFGQ
jgi:membrane-bound lytic murein transglycosylase B